MVMVGATVLWLLYQMPYFNWWLMKDNVQCHFKCVNKFPA